MNTILLSITTWNFLTSRNFFLIMFHISLLVHGLLIASVGAHFGIDLSVPTNSSTFDCLVNEQKVEYAIFRTFRSIGIVDENAPDSIRAAHKAGITALSAYIFPCMPTSPYSIANNIVCASPREQIDQTIGLLATNNIYFKGSNTFKRRNPINEVVELTTMWLDVEDESPSTYYDPNPTANQAFLGQIKDALLSYNISVGVYTTKTYWNAIMDNAQGYGQFPLWYPRYDGENSLAFFEPFADFSEVTIKQTGGDVGYCGISQVDSDYADAVIQ